MRRRRHTFRAPPLFTAGGMVVFGIGGLLGRQTSNMLRRLYEGMNPTTQAPTLPSGITSVQQYNDLVQSVKPGLPNIGIGFGVSLLGFLGGWMAPWPIVKLFAYGFGFGALFDIGGALIDGYVVVPLFSSATQQTATTGTTTAPTASTYGQMMYQHEITAQAAQTTAAGVSGGATLGAPPTQHAPPPGHVQQISRNGTPVAAAARPALPAASARVPASLASVARTPAHAMVPRAGTTGQPAPPSTVPGPGFGPAHPLGNNVQLPTQQQTFGGLVPGQGSISPRQPAPPTVATPAPPGQPTSPSPLPYVPGGCAPDCACGKCSGRGPVTMGEPPDDEAAAVVESFFTSQIAAPARRRVAWGKRAA
jgi:hypothetical protein